LLHLCSAFGRAEAARYCVVNLHFDVDSVMPRTNETPITLAVWRQQVPCAKQLLRLGADISVKDAEQQTLAYSVVVSGTPEM